MLWNSKKIGEEQRGAEDKDKQKETLESCVNFAINDVKRNSMLSYKMTLSIRLGSSLGRDSVQLFSHLFST